nr:PREDICTED: transmembrane protease serine 2 [Latimeria chalumnae]|eukprot:XP_014342015.1 PREDICTED: transmembrane protease serine 2 [Latimeria chalumnae]
MAEKVPCSPFYSLRLNESNDVTKNAQLNSVNRELQKSQLTIFDGIGLMETFKMTITDFALHLQEKQDFSVFNELSGSRSIVITVVVLVVLVLAGIAAALIYYFVFSCSNNKFLCENSGQCVSASEWCDGIPQCPDGSDEKQCVRLYGPSFLLQAYSAKKQSWEPVCSDNWTNNYGQAICSQIGYESTTYYKSGTQPQSSSSSGYLKLDPSLINTEKQFYKMLSSSKSCSMGSILTLRCIDCGTRTPPSKTSRIVGGNTAQPGNWPWQVSLQVYKTHLCGGTIITPYWIVTAAHCVEDYSDPKQWRVYSGILKRSEMNIWKGNFVAKIIAHKGYNSKTKHKDIALMKLESPLTFSDTIRPVCLPNFGQQFLPDTTCWISGWGSTREGGSSSNDMMVASVPIISTAECNSRLVYNGMISSTMTCAGYLIGGIDSCQGDSGGPLVTQQHSSWWLVGVTSWGEGCARRNRPGVYGKVTELLDWIYLTMQAN